MKKKLIRLSESENALVTKAANSDLDAKPLTDSEWSKVKPKLIRGRGRPIGSGSKAQVTLRIDVETLSFYKSKGDGWQTFINDILGEVKKEIKSVALLEKKLNKGELVGCKSKSIKKKLATA